MTRHVAFLASRFGEFEKLRDTVYKRNPQIWVAEHSASWLSSLVDSNEKTERITTECLARVRESKIFICVLGRGYGSLEARIVRNRADISLLEMEIFQALIERKPFVLFTPQTFNPESRLASLANVLRSIPEIREYTFKQCAEILDRINKIARTRGIIFVGLRRLIHGDIPLLRLPRRRLAKKLLAGHQPLFFNDDSAKLPEPSNPNLVNELVAAAEGEPDHAKKLAVLWWAVRYLCATPYSQNRDPAILSLWVVVLKNWASSAAWYGFHGDHILSRLAAVNALLLIRSRLSQSPEYENFSLHGTQGGKASEYYSIAKQLPRGSLKKKLFKQVIGMIDETLMDRSENLTGFRLIRASALLQLGRTQEAVDEYRYVAQLRTQGGAKPGEIGEALAELGYSLMRAGAIKEGRCELEKGVALLGESNRYPFEVRARVKLAICYLVTLHVRLACNEFIKAHDIALAHTIKGFLQTPLGKFLSLVRRK